jgi:hypothetical protein
MQVYPAMEKFGDRDSGDDKGPWGELGSSAQEEK